jgi:hypothetical protein
MKLTPEQIQGVLELEPNAQIDRLQGEKPYIRTGYWNRNRDLESLNAGLAKLGLKAEEYDDYDEDTGYLYWYVLEPISNELSPEDQATVDKYEDDDANREMNRMDADMYKESIDLNRWAKLAGINESIDPSKLKEYHEFLLNIGGYDLAGDYNEMASHANQYDSFEDFVKDEVKVLDDPETVGLITNKYL